MYYKRYILLSRNERIQSRAAKKRSRLASREGKNSVEDMDMDIDIPTNMPTTPSPDPEDLALPALTPLKKMRLDLESMPPPSMYLASHALLLEKDDIDRTDNELFENRIEEIEVPDHEADIQVLGNFGRPLLLDRKMVPNRMLNGLNRGPIMSFTMEERSYIKHLWETEMQTAQAIPVPVATLCKIRDAVKSGSVLPMDAAVEGYKICMQRVVEYAKQVDEFSK